MKCLQILCGEFIRKNKVNVEYLTKELKELINDLVGYRDDYYLDYIIRRGTYHPFKLFYKNYKKKNKNNNLYDKAIKVFNIEVIDYLFLHEQDHSLFYACQFAIKENRLNVLKYFCDKYPHLLNKKLFSHIIITENRLLILKYLVENGVEIDNRSMDIAGYSNSLEIVKYLYELGYTFEKPILVLYYGIFNKNLEMVKFVLNFCKCDQSSMEYAKTASKEIYEFLKSSQS